MGGNVFGEGVGALLLVRVAAVAFFYFLWEDLWLWLPVSAGMGLVEELKCLSPVWCLLKAYTKILGEFV